MISLTNHDSSEGEQWGRYNLPRLENWLVGGLDDESYDFPIILGMEKSSQLTNSRTIIFQRGGGSTTNQKPYLGEYPLVN